MKVLIGFWRFVLVLLIILGIIAVLGLLFPFCKRKGKARWIRRLSRWALGVLGIRFTMKGGVPDERALDGRIPDGPGYLVCANHVSFADIFVLDAVLPCRFVAKKEIAGWPVFGWISKGVDTLFIDRQNRRAVLEIGNLMREAVEEGTNVLFFPEGTTSSGERLRPFYANLFQVAASSGAPVLPVCLRYTQNGKLSTVASYTDNTPLFTVIKRIVFNRGLGVEVTVLPPIDSKGKDRHQISSEAARMMSRELGVEDETALKEKARLERLQSLASKAASE